MKLGVDAGNHRVKVCGEYGLMEFISAIGEAREIKLQQQHGYDDMYFEYEGEKGFAGSLAEFESEFGGSIMGTTKAHRDTKIRTLIGIHRYCETYKVSDMNFEIVVGQPIVNHSIEDKEKMKSMLKGTHSITVNGIERTFTISKIEIAAEGVSSFWSSPKEGKVRILDIGSGTVNFATVIDSRYVDKDSGTLAFGVNTNKSDSLQSLSRGIATHVLKKWSTTDQVFIVGGIAETMLPHIREYFADAEILYPIFNGQYVNPIYANAIAFYIVAVNIYE
jgi:plasmid segregation protein ParM